jgi:hypothetical protein
MLISVVVIHSGSLCPLILNEVPRGVLHCETVYTEAKRSYAQRKMQRVEMKRRDRFKAKKKNRKRTPLRVQLHVSKPIRNGSCRRTRNDNGEHFVQRLK